MRRKDLETIAESLNYTRLRFEEYPYPTLELKQQRLASVESAIGAVRKQLRRKP